MINPRVTITIPKPQYDEMSAEADRKGVSLANYILKKLRLPPMRAGRPKKESKNGKKN